MEASVWSSYFMDLSPEDMVKAFSSKEWFKSEFSDEHALTLLERGSAEKIGKQFKEFANGYGVSFPQGHLWLKCDLAVLNPEGVIDTLKNWLDLFYAMGIRNAVLHPGGYKMIKEGYEPERISEVRVKALKEISEYIKGNQMTICLENIVQTSPLCEDLLYIIKTVGADNIGICLDTGHLNMVNGDQADFIKRAGSYLKALHIADNEGVYDQHMMPYGKGTVAWDKVVRALKENSYSGLFNLEIPGERNCPLPIRLAKLDYIKQVVALMFE